MNARRNWLNIKQIDKKIEAIGSLSNIEVPSKGWIRAMRTGLKMSLRQLGDRMGITPQGVSDMEIREETGSLTIKNLRAAADALDMQLYYVLIPKDGSLEALIEKKARDMAVKIVTRSSQTMKLEAQETSDERVKEAIDELTEELKRELPGNLWD